MFLCKIINGRKHYFTGAMKSWTVKPENAMRLSNLQLSMLRKKVPDKLGNCFLEVFVDKHMILHWFRLKRNKFKKR